MTLSRQNIEVTQIDWFQSGCLAHVPSRNDFDTVVSPSFSCLWRKNPSHPDLKPGWSLTRRVIFSLAAAFLFFSCTTGQQPKPTFQAGTRVGIVNGLEPYMTHEHVTILRVNSFSKKYDVDWNIPAYLEAKLTDELKSDTRYVVIPINSSRTLAQLNQLSNQINFVVTQRRVSSDLAKFVENVADEHDLDVVIIVKSYRGNSPWKIANTPIVLQGYGLFTRRTVLGEVRVKSSWVHAYAQIVVAVFGARPVALIGSGTPKLKKTNVKDFNVPANIKNIPRTELNKLRPMIQNYADQSVKKALQDVNLVSTEAESGFEPAHQASPP
jgi:hypothetical protein